MDLCRKVGFLAVIHLAISEMLLVSGTLLVSRVLGVLLPGSALLVGGFPPGICVETLPEEGCE